MPTTAVPAPVPLGDGTRARILAAALTLMSERGSAATSMRRLAAACDINVATLYHHFPSKAALLRAVIDEQRYDQRLAEAPPIDPALPPCERLAGLLRWLWGETEAERDIMRLLLGEGTRGDGAAQASIRQLLAALEAALAQWMATGFPELAERRVDPAVAARLVRRQLLALVAEHLVSGTTTTDDTAATDLATTLFG